MILILEVSETGLQLVLRSSPQHQSNGFSTESRLPFRLRVQSAQNFKSRVFSLDVGKCHHHAPEGLDFILFYATRRMWEAAVFVKSVMKSD